MEFMKSRNITLSQCLEYLIIKMMEVQLEQQSKNSTSSYKDEDIRLENIPFTYKRHKDTYYIPVYPRAFVEEVINIDYDRRTVTAKFVVFVTVCLKVDMPQLREFLSGHLILEFGYNQVIFIPEHITLENSPYLISKMPSKPTDDYVTYRINGAVECTANFDSMFFPFRRIEVSNHLCIRSQQFRTQQGNGNFRQYTIKYNIMMLLEKDHVKYAQFLPFFGSKFFGSFKIDYDSPKVAADVNVHVIQKNLSIKEMVSGIYSLVNDKKDQRMKARKKTSLYQAILQIRHGKKIDKRPTEDQLTRDILDQIFNHDEEAKEDFHPFKHIVFKFDMSSIKLAFVLQQEVPIWILSFITLFLFHADPNIGNKFSNIILLLVSYISVITGFRLNNVAPKDITFFEVKLMVLAVVPILLTISTTIDYYNMDLFNNRGNQFYNPFAIASLVIVAFSFAMTIIFLIFMWLLKFSCQRAPEQHTESSSERIIDWMNMIELEWGHYKLENKMKQIVKKSKESDIFSFHDSGSARRLSLNQDGPQAFSNSETLQVRRGANIAFD